MPAIHQGFGLPDIQTFFDDALGGLLLLLLAGKAKDRFGVADAEPSVPQQILNGRRQPQKPQRIRHRDTAFADFDGHFLLGKVELRDQLRITLGFFHGVEVFAL